MFDLSTLKINLYAFKFANGETIHLKPLTQKMMLNFDAMKQELTKEMSIAEQLQIENKCICEFLNHNNEEKKYTVEQVAEAFDNIQFAEMFINDFMEWTTKGSKSKN